MATNSLGFWIPGTSGPGETVISETPLISNNNEDELPFSVPNLNSSQPLNVQRTLLPIYKHSTQTIETF